MDKFDDVIASLRATNRYQSQVFGGSKFKSLLGFVTKFKKKAQDGKGKAKKSITDLLKSLKKKTEAKKLKISAKKPKGGIFAKINKAMLKGKKPDAAKKQKGFFARINDVVRSGKI